MSTEYCELGAGGTSVATPLFAGVLALVNERRFHAKQGPIGFVNPALYRLQVGDEWSDDAPIIDIKAPAEPIGGLYLACLLLRVTRDGEPVTSEQQCSSMRMARFALVDSRVSRLV